ncbi:MAG: cardiolipin synthase [Bradymonadaceae bacterium]
MHTLFHILIEETIGSYAGIYFLLVGDILALVSAPSVLRRRRGRPVSALSWLLALFLVPYLGVAFWWMVGRERLKRKRRARQQSSEKFHESLDHAPDAEAESKLREFIPILPRGLFEAHDSQSLSGPTAGNHVDLLVDGDDGFEAMERMIRSAEDYVHLLFYIWDDDETGQRLLDLLVEKAREGVEVRLLVDPIGSPSLDSSFGEPLRQAGGEIGKFLPPRYIAWEPTFNFRNHRKLIVSDGVEAYTGGMNVGDEYAHEWHDLGVRVRGPAVRDLEEVFLEDWFFATDNDLVEQDPKYLKPSPKRQEESDRQLWGHSSICTVCASGPDRPDEKGSALRDLFFHAAAGAEDRLWITTPYFVPGSEFVAGLKAAVQRGVDVRLLLPRDGGVPVVRHASRAFYPMLLNGGVRIWEYQPRILHAKAMLIDDRFAFVGSANVDVRSFEINFELGALISSEALNDELSKVFEAGLEQSREVTLEDTENLPWHHALLDGVAHLLSPYL